MKKTFLILATAFIVLLTASMALGYSSQFTYSSYLGSNQPPARIGGWFGQNSAFIIGLRPGVYYGPRLDYGLRQDIYNHYYPRNSGWYGSGYYGLRSGQYYGYGGYTGYGGRYYDSGRYSTPSYYYHGPI